MRLCGVLNSRIIDRLVANASEELVFFLHFTIGDKEI
jgi:hypothetical protein